MVKDEKNKYFDSFAWLIYKEVERYINERPEEFDRADEKCGENEERSYTE